MTSKICKKAISFLGFFPLLFSSYIPWNLHEPERGKFDFSGNLDLKYVGLMFLEQEEDSDRWLHGWIRSPAMSCLCAESLVLRTRVGCCPAVCWLCAESPVTSLKVGCCPAVCCLSDRPVLQPLGTLHFAFLDHWPMKWDQYLQRDLLTLDDESFIWISKIVVDLLLLPLFPAWYTSNALLMLWR